MIERFSVSLRDAVSGAVGYARETGRQHLGIGLLFYGIAASTDPASDSLAKIGVTVATLERELADPDLALDHHALAAVGIDLDKITDVVNDTFGTGALNRPDVVRQASGHFISTQPVLKDIYFRALDLADLLGHHTVYPAHTILAALSENSAGEELRGIGLTGSRLSELRRTMLMVLAELP